jgi:hypothetical protein
MKLTKSQFKQIIKEELESILKEKSPPCGEGERKVNGKCQPASPTDLGSGVGHDPPLGEGEARNPEDQKAIDKVNALRSTLDSIFDNDLNELDPGSRDVYINWAEKAVPFWVEGWAKSAARRLAEPEQIDL